MNVVILATKDCSHRPMLEKKLNEMNVDYDLKFVEDDSKAVTEYQVRSSPNLIIDDKVVFRASPDTSLPTDEELKNYLHK